MALFVMASGFFTVLEVELLKTKLSGDSRPILYGKVPRRLAERVYSRAEVYLFVCQAGAALSVIGLGWVAALASVRAELLLSEALPTLSIMLKTVTIFGIFLAAFFVLLTFGLQYPKAYALRKAEHSSMTLISAAVLIVVHWAFYPVLKFTNWLSRRLLMLAGAEQHLQGTAHSEKEILVLMKESNRRGLIDNTEMALVDSIFEFTETSAREIMIPRTEMVCLYSHLTFEQNRRIAVSEMHTRYPVCSPHKDNIIGFVHIKDLLKADEAIKDIKEIVRPLLKVHDSMQISVLLKLMQKKKSQMALLIDEFGGTSGLITFEDIIEQIVGEVQDEFDEERPRIERNLDGSHSIDGRMLIEEVNSFFGTSIATDDYDTVGGWMYSQVEMPPKKHSHTVWEDRWVFVIEEIDHLRISRIIVKKKGASNAGAPAAAE